MKDIRGVCPVIAMPFTNNGEVDYNSFEHLVKHLIKIGVHGITLFGIASEFHKLTDAEKYKLAEKFTAHTKDSNVFGMISVTDHSLEVAVKRAKDYERLGADCLMLLPPYFLNPPISAIKEHIMAVLEAVKIPVLIQYAPGETKVSIAVEDFVDIYDKYPNAMFKIENNPPVNYIKKLLTYRPNAVAMVGYAGLYMMDVLDINGKGVMPGCSFTEIYLAIYKKYSAGDTTAKILHSKLFTYISRWMQDCEYIIQAEKTILCERGLIDSEYCRRPSYLLTAEDRSFINLFLNDFAEYLRKGEFNG